MTKTLLRLTSLQQQQLEDHHPLPLSLGVFPHLPEDHPHLPEDHLHLPEDHPHLLEDHPHLLEGHPHLLEGHPHLLGCKGVRQRHLNQASPT